VLRVWCFDKKYVSSEGGGIAPSDRTVVVSNAHGLKFTQVCVAVVTALPLGVCVVGGG
jgi:hypothetical protein